MSAIYNNVFESSPDDLEVLLTAKDPEGKIEGKIPRDLEGTLFRNGPGLQTVGDDPLHFFDAHGYVAKAVFSSGSCAFKAAHVATPLYQDEVLEKRALMRRMFTNLPSRRKNFYNFDLGATASHDIYAWGGHVLAAHEQGHFDLDPDSLATKNESRWAKAAPEGHQLCPMPRVDPAAERLIAYSIAPGRKKDEITFYELDEEFRAARRASFDLATAPTLVHDLIFTERYYVVCESPARVSPLSVLWGKNTVFDAFSWPEGKSATIALATRDSEKRREMFRVDVPNGVREILHFANAYDDGDRVILDCIAYDAPFPYHVFAPPTLRERDSLVVAKASAPKLLRLTIDPEKGKIETKMLATIAAELPEVNPRFHGKKHAFVYVATPASQGDEPDPNAFLFFHAVAKIDVETGTQLVFDSGKNKVVSQPAFAEKRHANDASAEDDGYILFWELDLEEKETAIVLLDARDLKLLARVKLGVFLPPASHSSFFAGKP